MPSSERSTNSTEQSLAVIADAKNINDSLVGTPSSLGTMKNLPEAASASNPTKRGCVVHRFFNLVMVSERASVRMVPSGSSLSLGTLNHAHTHAHTHTRTHTRTHAQPTQPTATTAPEVNTQQQLFTHTNSMSRLSHVWRGATHALGDGSRRRHHYRHSCGGVGVVGAIEHEYGTNGGWHGTPSAVAGLQELVKCLRRWAHTPRNNGNACEGQGMRTMVHCALNGGTYFRKQRAQL